MLKGATNLQVQSLNRVLAAEKSLNRRKDGASVAVTEKLKAATRQTHERIHAAEEVARVLADDRTQVIP